MEEEEEEEVDEEEEMHNFGEGAEECVKGTDGLTDRVIGSHESVRPSSPKQLPAHFAVNREEEEEEEEVRHCHSTGRDVLCILSWAKAKT